MKANSCTITHKAKKQPPSPQTRHITAGSILLWENHNEEGLLEARASPLPVRGHLFLLTTQTHQRKEMERRNRKDTESDG